MKFNKALMAGYLIKDPELKVVGAKKTTLCTFTLAVQVDKEQPTTWWNVNAWGKKAEIMGSHLFKGSNVFIEGRVDTSEWEDKKTGDKKSKQVLTVNEFQFLGEPQGKTAPNTPNTPPAGF